MRCEALRELLDLYLDGELPEEANRKVERHLLRCPACAYEVRTLEQTRTMLQEAVAAVEPTPHFRERTLARLLDNLAPKLRPHPAANSGRQWSLDLLRDE